MWLHYEASIHIAIFILTEVFNFVELVFKVLFLVFCRISFLGDALRGGVIYLECFGRCLRHGLLRARYRSVFALQRTKPCKSLSRFFYLELCFLRGISELFELLGRCLRPGLIALVNTLLLLRNELNHTFPYRGIKRVV